MEYHIYGGDQLSLKNYFSLLVELHYLGMIKIFAAKGLLGKLVTHEEIIGLCS